MFKKNKFIFQNPPRTHFYPLLNWWWRQFRGRIWGKFDQTKTPHFCGVLGLL